LAEEHIVLSPDMARRVQAALAWIERRRAGERIEAETDVPPPDDTVPVQNISGATWPRFALMRVTGQEADLATFSGDRFAYPGWSLAIATADIPDGAGGRAWLAADGGVYPLLVANLSSLSVGDRVGEVVDEWAADKDFMGPFVVVSTGTGAVTTTQVASTTGGAEGLVMVQYLPPAAPPLLMTTSAPAGMRVNAKQVGDDFCATGDEREFWVGSCGEATTAAPTTTV